VVENTWVPASVVVWLAKLATPKEPSPRLEQGEHNASKSTGQDSKVQAANFWMRRWRTGRAKKREIKHGHQQVYEKSPDRLLTRTITGFGDDRGGTRGCRDINGYQETYGWMRLAGGATLRAGPSTTRDRALKRRFANGSIIIRWLTKVTGLCPEAAVA